MEKLKGVADTLNRGIFLDPDYHVLRNGVDHMISHILFSQNVVVMWKKHISVWEANVQTVHIDSYPYGNPKFVDPARKKLTLWKMNNTWEIAGMKRPMSS